MATAMALATPATVKQVFFLVDGRTGLALMADGGRLRFFSTYNAADGAYFCVGAVLHILQVLPHDTSYGSLHCNYWLWDNVSNASNALRFVLLDGMVYSGLRNSLFLLRDTHGASSGALRLHGGGDTRVADELPALAAAELAAASSFPPPARNQTGAASALALGGRSVHKPRSRFQPPDPMPPALAAAGFEASVWADSRKFGKPAQNNPGTTAQTSVNAVI